MQLRVLGSIDVWHGGQRLALGGRQQRALLAMLLIEAGRVVSTDRLIAEIWGDAAPTSVRRLLNGASGHRLAQARALVVLGHALYESADVDTALRRWREARNLFTDIGVAEAEEVRGLIDKHRQRRGA
jgi:DNA-binding SARP family transcriptional activator